MLFQTWNWNKMKTVKCTASNYSTNIIPYRYHVYYFNYAKLAQYAENQRLSTRYKPHNSLKVQQNYTNCTRIVTLFFNDQSVHDLHPFLKWPFSLFFSAQLHDFVSFVYIPTFSIFSNLLEAEYCFVLR